MDDCFGYGYPFRPSKLYNGGGSDVGPTMMMWCLVSLIIGCKELWWAIDNKLGAFCYNDWEGHILTHVHGTYMQYETLKASIITPFKSMVNKTDQHMFG